jgi:hypothetical protein
MAAHGNALQHASRRADDPCMTSTQHDGAGSTQRRTSRAAIVCAWCRVPVQGGAPRRRAGETVSHGLCAPCARRLARSR